MRIAALALDYDGTVATEGVFDPTARDAIAEARRSGIAAVLVTGRRLSDLKDVAGDLTGFDAVVCENGAVLDFPSNGRHQLLGHPPGAAFLRGLHERGVDFGVGESIVEADASAAPAILEVLRALEQPLILAFNRDRVMVLPQSVGKSTGLRHALLALRLSIHNTLGIGDAENDHDLLNACEIGVAVEWGTETLRVAADRVIAGTGPPAVAAYIRRIARQPWLPAGDRRRITLGRDTNGHDVNVAVRGRTMLVAGERGSGKSWLAGLICEQSILQGYSVCLVDPGGDFRSLEALPGVIRYGDEQPPRARQLLRVLRHPDLSVIVDLSKISHHEKTEYLPTLLRLIGALRRTSGLPHRIVIDDAHHFLGSSHSGRLIDNELSGYVLVTSKISCLAPELRAANAVVLITRETDPEESQMLLQTYGPRPGAAESVAALHDLAPSEAALLPGEDGGELRRFRLGPRLT
jgi:hydroxymethylpyrimidine pyrophosphatase-like HAD family hydrolase